MAFLKIPIAFMISILFTQVALAEPIYASLEALTTPTVREGDEGDRRTVVVKINLSSAPTEEVQVRLQSFDHDALAGIDYHEFDETFIFSPGEMFKALVIETIPNNIDNPYKRKFMLKLGDPVGVKLNDPVLIVTIIDDDEILSMDSTFNVLETDEGEVSYIDVVVKREFDNEEEAIVFDLKTKDGTALAGKDYETESYEGMLLPGELEKTFRFTVIGDNEFEEYEQFYINLIPRSDRTRTSNSPAPIYIQDNDGDFYFTYNLDVVATARSEDGMGSVRGQTSGEIPLKRFVNTEGNISYEGEAVHFY